MGIYKTANELQKQSSLIGTGLWMGGSHIAQNIMVSNRLLNRQGGVNVAKSLIPENREGIKGATTGVKNTAMPEAGIIRGEVAHSLSELGDMNRGERAAVQALARGEFNKVLNSRTFKNSPKLKEFMQKKGINPDLLHMTAKTNPNIIKEYEDAYKKNPIGKMMHGVADEGAKIPAQALKNIGKDITKSEAIGEAVGNTMVGAVEPGIAVVNGLKRYGADKISNISSRYGKAKAAIQNKIKDRFVNRVVSKDIDDGSKGKRISKTKLIAKKYLLNPITAEAGHLGNEFELISRKNGLPSPFNTFKIVKNKKGG